MQPTTDWDVYLREFTAAELAGLDLKSDSNWFEVDFGCDQSHSIPPEDVEVAWFAVTYGAPD